MEPSQITSQDARDKQIMNVQRYQWAIGHTAAVLTTISFVRGIFMYSAVDVSVVKSNCFFILLIGWFIIRPATRILWKFMPRRNRLDRTQFNIQSFVSDN